MTLLSVDRSDLIKTIEEDDEVVADDGSSDEDDVAQPKKNKAARKAKKDFESDFSFVSSQKEYMRDTWNDVAKYVKKKAKTNLDDKIAKVRKERKARAENGDQAKNNDDEEQESDGSDEDSSEEELSEDEMVEDAVKTKEGDAKRKHRKRKKNPEASDTGVDIQVEKDDDEEDDYFDSAPTYDDTASFYTMNLSRPLLKAIEDLRYVHPTPIQAATIPVALLGRDICGCAATGTGKTAAYMLPVLERLLYRPVESARTRVLVLVPTRELGVQVYQVTRQLAQFTSVEVALSVGGLDLKTQESLLRRNPDIVIATPGRLIDHVKNTPTFSLENIEVLILDEADRMLEEAFMEQMKEIVKSCSRTRQTLLFSATMTDQVEQLATVSLNKPVKVFVDSNKVVAWNLRQEFVRVRREEEREALLAALVCRTFRDHTMVFIQTKAQCHRLHIVLGLLGVRVGELHGNMSQPQRMETLQRFKEEQLDVLLATDVAARGLDIRGVKTVINFTMPTTLEHYIHRVGRTARAGRAGRSVSLAGEGERKMVRDIVKRARDPVKSRTVNAEIQAKYKAKLTKLEDDVNLVLEEEKADRELAKCENRAGKLQNQLAGAEDDRRWFQTKQQRKEEKQALKKKLKDPTFTKQKQKRKAEMAGLDPAEQKEREALAKEGDYIMREAKRARKLKKIRSVVEPAEKVNGGKTKQKKKSSFDAELTNTSSKSVKGFRHIANKRKSDDKRMMKKKPKGGGGGKNKGGGGMNKEQRKNAKKSSFR